MIKFTGFRNHIDVDLKQSIDFKDEYSLDCYFLGNSGIDDGEIGEELGTYSARLSKDALPYLLDSYKNDIDDAIKKHSILMKGGGTPWMNE